MQRPLLIPILGSVLIAVSGVALAAEPAGDSSCLEYEQYAHWVTGVGTPSWADDVAVANGFAFVAVVPFPPVPGNKGALIVQDLRDLADPQTIAQVSLPLSPRRVALLGSLAVVACGDSGIVTVSVADPFAPVRLGRLPMPGRAIDLVAGNGHAYVVCAGAGLAVVDLSDPTEPQLAGMTETGPYICVGGGGSYVGAADSTGFALISVSDPAHPVELARTHVPTVTSTLRVVGERAYLCGESRLTIVGWSYLRLPYVVATLPTEDWLTCVAVVDTVLVLGGYPITDGGAGLLFYRLLGDEVPMLVGQLRPFSAPWSFALAGSRLFAACAGGGIQIYDLGNGTTPGVPAGLPFEPSFADFACQGHRAYTVARGGEFSIIDFSDPVRPDLLGQEVLARPQSRVAVRGALAVAVGDRLFTIDVSSPAEPRVLGELPLPDISPFEVVLHGSLALVAAGRRGLLIVDLTDPAHPELASTFDSRDQASAVAARDGVAFLADGSGGIVAIDILDPRAPKELSRIVTTRPASDIALRGDRALVLHVATGIRVVDVSNPRSMHTIGGARSPSAARAVQVAGDFGYVATEVGLQVVDLTDPTRVRSVGSVAFPSLVSNVGLVGGRRSLGDADRRANPPRVASAG